MNQSKKHTRILFVCLGNICRSPSAETIFSTHAARRNLSVTVDSAGTSAYHQGELADSRMRQAAAKRGYSITSISRGFIPDDFNRFDMIVAMDDNNYYDLKAAAQSIEHVQKISKMKDYFIKHTYDHIPDPYYGGAAGFDLVIDLLEDASQGLINFIENKEI